MSRNKQQKQKGFTLLFAVLVTTLVVSISATIISIAIRQTILSSTSRESQYAFYAANTGLECAFYWDNFESEDPSITGFVFPADGDLSTTLNPDAINCVTQPLNITPSPSLNTITYTFNLTIGDDFSIGEAYPDTCAEVKVHKTLNSERTIVTTKIESRGWNTCDETNPRRVERGIELIYRF